MGRRSRLALIGGAALLACVGPVQGAILLQEATATFSQTSGFNHVPSLMIDGDHYGSPGGDTYSHIEGWAVYPATGSPQTAVFETAADVGFTSGTLLTFTLDQHYGGYSSCFVLGKFRLSVTDADRGAFADGLAVDGQIGSGIWTELAPISAASEYGTRLTIQSDNSILAAQPSAQDVYTITAVADLPAITGFRLEALTDSSLPNAGPGWEGTYGNFVLNEFTVDAQEYQPQPGIPEPGSAVVWCLLAVTGFAVRRLKRRV